MKEIKSKMKTYDAMMDSFSGIVDSLRKITGNPNLLKSLELGYDLPPKLPAKIVDLGSRGE
ncbi:hypothetical protein [Candidatus Nitrosotalea bavarica]|uniref:hypothetical protein n=1 Tax=Candidatus Nitrosotalea bavarica TaxID=1903277 RepID=UPI000C708AFF|nr:hypothetical protein [Candidatus Nitrosotalea bavarica]